MKKITKAENELNIMAKIKEGDECKFNDLWSMIKDDSMMLDKNKILIFQKDLHNIVIDFENIYDPIIKIKKIYAENMTELMDDTAINTIRSLQNEKRRNVSVIAQILTYEPDASNEDILWLEETVHELNRKEGTQTFVIGSILECMYYHDEFDGYHSIQQLRKLTFSELRKRLEICASN